ncbi:hypothetical protein [Caulobacter soli]|uniref:phage head morphogenesis protein n=1 Tax=Caulobacter soli TaxID=2708539 RepID=UPI0013EC5B8A|nr:hypothetical protein [Caulobacter soli]
MVELSDAQLARQAFDQVCDDLPSGFIDRDVIFHHWFAEFETGSAHPGHGLIPLLPRLEAWPSPTSLFICDQLWSRERRTATLPHLFFRTVMSHAQRLGRLQREARTSATFPFAQYLATPASHPTHRAFDGVVLRVADPWWIDHTPPIGWGCVCGRRVLNARMIAREDLKVWLGPPL